MINMKNMYMNDTTGRGTLKKREKKKTAQTYSYYALILSIPKRRIYE